jgi:hypothetical protein
MLSGEAIVSKVSELDDMGYGRMPCHGMWKNASRAWAVKE